MRNKSIIQVGVVASADPNQFEEQLNSRLREPKAPGLNKVRGTVR